MTEDDFNAWKDGAAFKWFAARCLAKMDRIKSAMADDAVSYAGLSPLEWASIQPVLAGRKGYVDAVTELLSMEYADFDE